MSDEQQPDEQSLSKRERQKLRRQRKLDAQRAEARRAKRRRTVMLVALVLLLVGTTGAFATQWALDRVEERRLVTEAEENLEALGCTPVEEQPIQPSEHFTGPDLAANPPDVVYQDRPTTSGRHIGRVVQTGVYDKVIDERLLVHNLEHGYVNVFYGEDAPADHVDDLKDVAREQIDSGRHEKLIVSAWTDDLPGDMNFAMTAWGGRQLCRDFDPGVLLGFLDEWHWLAGDAPENSLPVHDGGQGGGLDPEETDGDMLFPPLGEEGDDIDVDADVMDDADDSGDTGDGG